MCFYGILQVCGVGTLIMTSSVEQPKKPQPLLIFAMELLEVATIEPPPNMEGQLFFFVFCIMIIDILFCFATKMMSSLHM